MKKIISSFAIFCILALAFSACAAPPLEEMQKAQDAVILAENDADAVAYAGNLVIHARDALTRMESEAESKRYDAVKEFAAEAINSAERAIAEGQSAKGRARSEAAALLDATQNSLSETQNTVNTAKGVPNILLDFDALAQDLDEAHRIYDEEQQSFQTGDYRDAVANGQSVRSILSDINTVINEAAFDTSRKQ